MSLENLPKKIFVKIEKEREPADNFLIASENHAGLAEGVGESVEIGEYHLVAKGDLKTSVEFRREGR